MSNLYLPKKQIKCRSILSVKKEFLKWNSKKNVYGIVFSRLLMEATRMAECADAPAHLAAKTDNKKGIKKRREKKSWVRASMDREVCRKGTPNPILQW